MPRNKWGRKGMQESITITCIVQENSSNNHKYTVLEQSLEFKLYQKNPKEKTITFCRICIKSCVASSVNSGISYVHAL